MRYTDRSYHPCNYNKTTLWSSLQMSSVHYVTNYDYLQEAQSLLGYSCWFVIVHIKWEKCVILGFYWFSPFLDEWQKLTLQSCWCVYFWTRLYSRCIMDSRWIMDVLCWQLQYQQGNQRWQIPHPNTCQCLATFPPWSLSAALYS